MNIEPAEEILDPNLEDNVIKFAAPAKSGTDNDWLSALPDNTVFLSTAKGSNGYILEEYLKSWTRSDNAVLLVFNGYTGGPKVDIFWVIPDKFSRANTFYSKVETQDGKDHQPPSGVSPADE